MATTELEFPLPTRAFANGTRLVEGRLVEVRADGAVLVEFPGAPTCTVRARTACEIPSPSSPVPVLLMLDDDRAPLIVGVIRDSARLESESTRDRVVLEAEHDLEIRCGKAAIVLRRDGTVTIRGTRLLSRASEVNRIRGGIVQIN